MTMSPSADHFPIYIPSKGRHDIRGTARLFDRLGLPNYTLIVEEYERAKYANKWGSDRVAVLPRVFQEEFETCDEHGLSLPLGVGLARNFAWHLAEEAGAAWHWAIDDNQVALYRYDGTDYTIVTDGPKFFADMEKIITGYRNLGMAGPHDEKFIIRGESPKPAKNTRIYSFNAMRTDLPIRWRGRWNDDTILTLDMLTNRWCTLLFRHMLMDKAETWTSRENSAELKGGCSDDFYRVAGTGPKSRLLARVYPHHVKVVQRFSRIHHFVDYRKHFSDIPLIPVRQRT